MTRPEALPFETTLYVKEHCLCLAAQRAARALARRFDAAFAPFNLTNGQFSLLMALNRPQPPLMRDVASLLAMDRTTLTAMLKPLERRKLAQVRVDEKDRRGRRLMITHSGRVLLAKAFPVWRHTLNELEHAAPDTESLRAALWSIS
jgi:DNA-binding MarR family transcriptional regulator